MAKDTILITGGSGLLGSSIAKNAVEDFNVFATYNSHPTDIPGCEFIRLDVRDSDQTVCVLDRIRPQLVVHTAGMVSMESCEQRPNDAWIANVHGTANVALAAKKAGAKLISISSNGVFDGLRGMYTELDVPRSTNVYASTKIEGERLVRQMLPDSIVVRTAFYGWGLHNRASLAEWVLDSLRRGKRIRMFTDAYFTPILVTNLAEALLQMYRKGLAGIYHVDGSERCSKYEFGRAIARAFGLDEDAIEPSTIDEAGFLAPRPKDLSLDNSAVSKHIHTRLLGMEEGIAWFKRLEDERLARQETGSGTAGDSTLHVLQYGRHWIENTDVSAVAEVLRGDRVTQGPKVEEFERAVAEYCGVKHAVAVNSGTSALHIACLATGVKSGHEVITSPITFVASANCVAYCGAAPVFADIDERTYNISPAQVSAKITERTRAVIPVHFAGQSCDMHNIRIGIDRAGDEYGHRIFIIEDASHALGSLYKGGKVGACTYSDMVALSFHPVKHITTGEGGMVLTNDDSLYDALRLFRSHGITNDPADFTNREMAFQSPTSSSANPWYYEQVTLGYNYRLTDIQCALGLSQLRKLDRFRQRRREIVERYNSAFGGLERVRTPVESADCESNFHLYVLLLDFEAIGMTRAEVMLELKGRGIQTQVHYIPVHLQPFYRSTFGTGPGDYPRSEAYYQRCLSLPLFPQMSDADVERVVVEVKNIVEGRS